MEAKYLFIALGAGVVIGTLLALVYTYYLKAKWGALSKEKASIIDEAQRESESIKKEARVEAKDIIFQSRAEADKELNERRNELSQLERRLMQKDETLERKLEQVEKRDGEINKREKDIASQEQSIRDRKAHLEGLVKEQKDTLERLSGITSDEARTELFKRIEDESRLEASKLAKRMEDEAVEQAEKKAQEIVSSTIQRYASDYIADATVSSVSLPSDELKGRIIGREGRNIRALEAATGVDFIVDDTPEVVTLSAFDPVRREIARLALEKLIADGRIHPARIEEIAVKVKKEVDAIIVEEGEKSVFDLGLAGIHPELIKLLGRLKYRTSYGQNVLQHSREVAYLAGMMAGELGVDVKLAKRAGLLHDIGKAIDHEIEGSHHEIGATLAKKYGEKDVVVNAIGAHHGDIEVDSVEASLVAAADALSAARPGVRRESIENYIKRLQQLEEMAMSYDGVEKCFAVQAGREVRLIVKPDKINDDMSWNIAKELSKKIEQEMSYPGQIKVTVIRESRYVEYAK